MSVIGIADLPRAALPQFEQKPVIIIRQTSETGFFIRPAAEINPVLTHFLPGRLPEVCVIGIRIIKNVSVFIGDINQEGILDRELIDKVVQVFIFAVFYDFIGKPISPISSRGAWNL